MCGYDYVGVGIAGVDESVWLYECINYGVWLYVGVAVVGVDESVWLYEWLSTCTATPFYTAMTLQNCHLPLLHRLVRKVFCSCT